MINRINEVRYNNFGSEMIIVGYHGSKDIDVSFPEYNYIARHRTYSNFKNGEIKCPYERRVHGEGYLGVGEHKAVSNGKKTKVYKAWNSMIERCYDKRVHAKNPTYTDCEVCEEWKNFQNFAEWFEQNYYEIEEEKTCLDKDILIKGNKIYSPDTCVFVPQSINTLFVKCDATRGNLPIGVSYKKRINKYMAQCNLNGQIRFLGYYSNPEEAFQAYKRFKESVIQSKADEYLYQIPENLYEAMINYEVEEND